MWSRPELDERRRRPWAAAEAHALGYGGVSLVAHATGLARSTIYAGLRDLRSSSRQRRAGAQRVRRVGGGRRFVTSLDPALLDALVALIEATRCGDPESPLRWTCKSTRQLAQTLTRQRHPVSPRTVATLLKEDGYSLQADRKPAKGPVIPIGMRNFAISIGGSPDVCAGGCRRSPSLRRRRNWYGDFKNGGREWRQRGDPTRVCVHGFLDRRRGKAIPYGVYDLAK